MLRAVPRSSRLHTAESGDAERHALRAMMSWVVCGGAERCAVSRGVLCFVVCWVVRGVLCFVVCWVVRGVLCFVVCWVVTRSRSAPDAVLCHPLEPLPAELGAK